MGNYGIKTSKKGEDATSSDVIDILMTTKYPFTKIDQTNQESFRTTTVTFITDVAENTDIIFYQFAHGYDYEPQLWGLWDITWSPSLGGANMNGYGQIVNSTGFPSSSVWYTFDETNIYLHIYKGDAGLGLSSVGITVTLSTYIFADELMEQDYTQGA